MLSVANPTVSRVTDQAAKERVKTISNVTQEKDEDKRKKDDIRAKFPYPSGEERFVEIRTRRPKMFEFIADVVRRKCKEPDKVLPEIVNLAELEYGWDDAMYRYDTICLIKLYVNELASNCEKTYLPRIFGNYSVFKNLDFSFLKRVDMEDLYDNVVKYRKKCRDETKIDVGEICEEVDRSPTPPLFSGIPKVPPSKARPPPAINAAKKMEEWKKKMLTTYPANVAQRTPATNYKIPKTDPPAPKFLEFENEKWRSSEKAKKAPLPPKVKPAAKRKSTEVQEKKAESCASKKKQAKAAQKRPNDQQLHSLRPGAQVFLLAPPRFIPNQSPALLTKSATSVPESAKSCDQTATNATTTSVTPAASKSCNKVTNATSKSPAQPPKSNAAQPKSGQALDLNQLGTIIAYRPQFMKHAVKVIKTHPCEEEIFKVLAQSLESVGYDGDEFLYLTDFVYLARLFCDTLATISNIPQGQNKFVYFNMFWEKLFKRLDFLKKFGHADLVEKVNLEIENFKKRREEHYKEKENGQKAKKRDKTKKKGKEKSVKYVFLQDTEIDPKLLLHLIRDILCQESPVANIWLKIADTYNQAYDKSLKPEKYCHCFELIIRTHIDAIKECKKEEEAESKFELFDEIVLFDTLILEQLFTCPPFDLTGLYEEFIRESKNFLERNQKAKLNIEEEDVITID